VALVVRSVLPLVFAMVVPMHAHAPLHASAPTHAAAPTQAPLLPGAGTWLWPVLGPVIGAFEPPETPFGAGHRGIDIAASLGTQVLAPDAGVVAFAAKVGGELFVTLDHGAGVTSTYSWISATLVRKGDAVARGAAIARTGRGHPGSAIPHLHFGVRRDGVYLDPMAFLAPASVSGFIRLAPLVEPVA
jgi:murein DD-endopeptidase MepM/ murein hydrolase activator NlpD